MNRVFYDIEPLSKTDVFDILRFVYDSRIKFWVDELDCSKSFRREKLSCNFDYAISNYFQEKFLFRIVRERFLLPIDIEEYGCEEVGLFVLSSLNGSGPDYFIWVYTSVAVLVDVLKKYSLKEM